MIGHFTLDEKCARRGHRKATDADRKGHLLRSRQIDYRLNDRLRSCLSERLVQAGCSCLFLDVFYLPPVSVLESSHALSHLIQFPCVVSCNSSKKEGNAWINNSFASSFVSNEFLLNLARKRSKQNVLVWMMSGLNGPSVVVAPVQVDAGEQVTAQWAVPTSLPGSRESNNQRVKLFNITFG